MHQPCGFSAPLRQVCVFISRSPSGPVGCLLAGDVGRSVVPECFAMTAVTLLAVTYMRAGPVSLDEYSGNAMCAAYRGALCRLTRGALLNFELLV